MPMLDNDPDFPVVIHIHCLFCADEESDIFLYQHGKLWDVTWQCPACKTVYRAGRAMYGNISAPFIKIESFNGIKHPKA